MAPHLRRAQSAYKDIRLHPFHHTHINGALEQMFKITCIIQPN